MSHLALNQQLQSNLKVHQCTCTPSSPCHCQKVAIGLAGAPGTIISTWMQAPADNCSQGYAAARQGSNTFLPTKLFAGSVNIASDNAAFGNSANALAVDAASISGQATVLGPVDSDQLPAVKICRTGPFLIRRPILKTLCSENGPSEPLTQSQGVLCYAYYEAHLKRIVSIDGILPSGTGHTARVGVGSSRSGPSTSKHATDPPANNSFNTQSQRATPSSALNPIVVNSQESYGYSRHAPWNRHILQRRHIPASSGRTYPSTIPVDHPPPLADLNSSSVVPAQDRDVNSTSYLPTTLNVSSPSADGRNRRGKHSTPAVTTRRKGYDARNRVLLAPDDDLWSSPAPPSRYKPFVQSRIAHAPSKSGMPPTGPGGSTDWGRTSRGDSGINRRALGLRQSNQSKSSPLTFQGKSVLASTIPNSSQEKLALSMKQNAEHFTPSSSTSSSLVPAASARTSDRSSNASLETIRPQDPSNSSSQLLPSHPSCSNGHAASRSGYL